MRTIFSAALAVGLMVAPVAMADELSTSEARGVVKALLVTNGRPGEYVGTAQRQGGVVVVQTMTKEGLPYRALRVDVATGHVEGFPNAPMTGQRETGPNG